MNNKEITNERLARLNDVAYRSVRKAGLQKMLDQRAIDNKDKFAQMEENMRKYISGLDFGTLAKTHAALLDEVGNCHLSCLNALECLEQEDCLCLALSISRSEAAIADPTQIRIKEIIPAFISINSFLDFAEFSINAGTADVSFDPKNTGEFAQGISRESITGVLPLFLFTEHWEVARRIMP